jgi:hypothetical protein
MQKRSAIQKESSNKSWGKITRIELDDLDHDVKKKEMKFGKMSKEGSYKEMSNSAYMTH